MIQRWDLQQGIDLAERIAVCVDQIRGDLQTTDDVHNNLVDLVLEVKNEVADLTRRVEVVEQRATEAEETIAAMMTGSSDTSMLLQLMRGVVIADPRGMEVRDWWQFPTVFVQGLSQLQTPHVQRF
ncbi:hypothetical protein L1987_43416 [Smallanthus sonchifolius]|uniref:Uncharacterized protein n=1 Tax=Smallanthus sonchifolius TaxID=185202 RepID=A0ACB9GMC1_9ASTR|nr:hypothetical protein L1987_43416 [Smallanthus sonchifolius]